MTKDELDVAPASGSAMTQEKLETGPLAIVEERRVAPGVERVEPLLGLARGTGVDSVHVDAVGAAVDLRRAQLQQVHERVIEAAGGEMLLEREHCLQRAPAELLIINAHE